MAPGWERWRAQLAHALTPVREWLIGKLGQQPGETVRVQQLGGELGLEELPPSGCRVLTRPSR